MRRIKLFLLWTIGCFALFFCSGYIIGLLFVLLFDFPMELVLYAALGAGIPGGIICGISVILIDA